MHTTSVEGCFGLDFPSETGPCAPDPLWQQHKAGIPIDASFGVVLGFPTHYRRGHHTGKWGAGILMQDMLAGATESQTLGLFGRCFAQDMFRETVLMYVLLPITQILSIMTHIFSNMSNHIIVCCFLMNALKLYISHSMTSYVFVF